MITKAPEFDLTTTCSFTGHRIIKKNFDDEFLDKTIEETIKKGYKTFLVGLARGFDLKCAKILIEKKNKYNIDVIGCIPCKEQDKFYKKKEREEYREVLEKIDKKIYFSENYIDGCMQQRNRFMIDNSSLLIAYYYNHFGGTYYTVCYAEKQNKNIIYLQ